jgi:uncharacterized integral membrane protein
MRAEPEESPGDLPEPHSIDWGGAFQRVVLIVILLGIAVLLVVGTQNYDERVLVRFLAWSREMRLLAFFLLSVAAGILIDETLRLLLRPRRRPPEAEEPAAEDS